MWPFKRRPKCPVPERTSTGTRVLTAIQIHPDQVRQIGEIPNRVVYGFVDEDGPEAGIFRPNPAFVAFMQRLISTVGPDGLSEVASGATEDTHIYLIDLRTPDGPQGRVPMEDIIGCFEVKDRKIVSDTYWANRQHVLHTQNGRFQLPPPFNAILEHALISHVEELVQAAG